MYDLSTSLESPFWKLAFLDAIDSRLHDGLIGFLVTDPLLGIAKLTTHAIPRTPLPN